MTAGETDVHADKPAFHRLAPPDRTVSCPCGATLAGNDVRPYVLGLFHAEHDGHTEKEEEPCRTE